MKHYFVVILALYTKQQIFSLVFSVFNFVFETIWFHQNPTSSVATLAIVGNFLIRELISIIFLINTLVLCIIVELVVKVGFTKIMGK